MRGRGLNPAGNDVNAFSDGFASLSTIEESISGINSSTLDRSTSNILAIRGSGNTATANVVQMTQSYAIVNWAGLSSTAGHAENIYYTYEIDV